jgi:hypothetical protein
MSIHLLDSTADRYFGEPQLCTAETISAVQRHLLVLARPARSRSDVWAIFSDKYGVWFPEIKHTWYETSPDEALPEFARLLSDFDEKMRDCDVIHICPNADGPRIHRLYRRLVIESRWKDRIRTTPFMDIA